MKSALKLLVLFILTTVITPAFSARILAAVPSPSYSHQVAFQQLWRELSLRGHQVTLITSNPMKDPSLKNLTEIDVSFMYTALTHINSQEIAQTSIFKFLIMLIEISYDIIDKELAHPEVQKLINNENEHFDVALVETIFPGMVLFAERFNCPLIQIFSVDGPSDSYYNFGNPVHPVLNPDLMLPFSGKLTFIERLLSTIYLCFSLFYNAYLIRPSQQAAVEKHFGSNYSDIGKIMSDASLMFVNTDLAFHPIRPVLPNVIQIGGYTHLSAPKPLPKNLQNILDNATNGVIYFSFGSNVKSKDLLDTHKIFLETFSELPYTVLWKFEEDDLPVKPDNKASQIGILGHPNIKLFISQGGLQSMDEATYHNIPIVGIPFFGDQENNVKRIIRLAELSKDQPMTGLERAVWWTEYVIRHKGAKHLRSPALDIPAYHGARILGIVSTPSFSHQVAFQPLWRELSLRGHQLVVVTTDPMNDPSLTNLTEIDLHFSYDIWNSEVVPIMNNPKDPKTTMDTMIRVMIRLLDQQLSHPDVQKLLESKDEHFDLVITELVAVTSGFSEKFKCPYIGVVANDATNVIYNVLGNPVNPIANPDINLPFFGKLDFSQRLISAGYNLLNVYYKMSYGTAFDAIMKKHFGKDCPGVEQLFEKISLLFVNANPILNQIRPIMPNIIQIRDRIHRQPLNPLPKDLQQHVDNATQGFIYFSLGSNVKSKDLPNATKAVLMETFSELPYKVLWKFELGSISRKPDNVIISKWFPQQDILKHPHLKLFITQGGALSIEEAVYDHVPMLGIPFFMDQPTNVKQMVAKGLGLSLDYKNIDKKTFKEAILEVINNPKYRNRAKELADLASDQPMTGLDKAVCYEKHTESIVVLTTDPMNDPSLTNLTEIDLHFSYDIWNAEVVPVMNNPRSPKKMFDVIAAALGKIQDQQLNHPEVQKLLRNETEHFDLLIMEVILSTVGFSLRFKCPYIAIVSSDSPNMLCNMFGNPVNPIANPDVSLPSFEKLNFFERLISVGYNLVMNYIVTDYLESFAPIGKKINGARILGIASTPSFSHQVMFRPLWRELSLRGHQVVLLTTDPMNDSSLANLTEIDLHFSYETWNKHLDPVMNNPEDAKVMMNLFASTLIKILDQQLSHSEVQKLIKSETEHFDLVIVEFAVPIAAVFAERFNCPLIAAISLDAPTFLYNLIGNPVNPIANPDINLPYIGKLNFFERFTSVAFNLIMERIIRSYEDDINIMLKKHFGENYPGLADIIAKTSLLFVNTNPVLNQIRPLMPNIIQIGGGTHCHSSKQLPKDLQQHLDNATQGFIYFSLGSNVKSKDLPDNLKTVFLESFSELPYKVLWKFELEDLPGKPDNVIISKWFPQQDVFRHPNIKLFISQGGMLSMEEAIYNYVPIVGIPFVGDQGNNVKRMEHKGIGLGLSLANLDKSSLKEAILEVANNPKYRNRVKELAELVKDQPMTGLERAVWWTEYVIRHKGAKHLRSPALDIPAYQYFLLDVIGFVLVVTVIVIYVLIKLIKLILRFIKYLLPKPKVKTQ
ncbi:hypothetical protein ILUMI_05090 [Ignelater luminosus]|uniref:Uncharacterized protein n=1 Tax=Ignelater luminosus TaxID=2038154 RepID=A0A8K0GDX0_IGNLU|nr:hypothetical protein ILUMI_05090 [Ignelater luminosus]